MQFCIIFQLFGLKWWSVDGFWCFVGQWNHIRCQFDDITFSWPWFFVIRNPRWPPCLFAHNFTSWVIWSTSVTMHGEQRVICLLSMLNQTFSGGDPRESMSGICESPKFKMATVGHFDYCILNGSAYISNRYGFRGYFRQGIYFWCQF